MDTASNEILLLLKEQNRLLHDLLNLQIQQEKQRTRRDHIAVLAKVTPLVVGLVLLVWLYFSVVPVLTDIQHQITEIQTNVGGVFKLIKDQYDYLKSFLSGFLDAMRGFIPDLSGVGETLKGLFPQ